MSRESPRVVSIAGRMALALVVLLLIVAAIGLLAGLLLPSLARLNGPLAPLHGVAKAQSRGSAMEDTPNDPNDCSHTLSY